MNEFLVDNLSGLRWLLLVVACAAAAVYGLAARRRALHAFAEAHLLGSLTPNLSRPRQVVKAALVLLAMVAISLALIGPRYGAYFEEVHRKRLDLMICLDVSRSMLVEDAGMSRLARAKDDIKRLLDQLAGSSIGLVCFAGRAELVTPLTDDYEFFRLALDDVGIHSAPLGGTNIAEALVAARRGLGGAKGNHRAIIVMSDGEDHGDSAMTEAKACRAEGITVFAIGIGDQDRGGLIPIEKNGRRSFVMYDGQQVWSKLDPRTLKRIASAGGGEYHPSGQVSPTMRTLEWVYTERLLPQQQLDARQKQIRRQRPRFAWPAALALALLVIEPLVSERKRER